MYFRHLWYLPVEQVRPVEPFVNGIRATAVSACAAGASPAEATARLRRIWTLMGEPPGVFALAAESITHRPLPAPESAEKTHRLRLVRRLLGVEPTDRLLALLAAREILEALAAEELSISRVIDASGDDTETEDLQ